jgi:hypothetical protein
VKPISASLKIQIQGSTEIGVEKLVGHLTKLKADQAELALGTPIEIDGTKIDRVLLKSKYGWPIEGKAFAQTVYAFWSRGPEQERKPLGEGVLQCDPIALSQMNSLREFYVRSSIVVFWLSVLSSAFYAGLRYHIVHGTVVSNLPILTHGLAFILSILFLLSIVGWAGPIGPADLGNILLGSLRSFLLFLVVCAGLTFFLFAFPAMGLVLALNAWLDSAPPTEIAGPIIRISPTLLTVRFVARGHDDTFQFHVVTVSNSGDGKSYEIDIPKELFDQSAIHVGTLWTDVIHHGALIPYRIGILRPVQAPS